MKNFINYYYNLFISDIRKKDDYYILSSNDCFYEFLPCYDDPKSIYDNYIRIIESYKYIHQIMFNINKSIITIYNNIPYILLKKNQNSDAIIDFDYIINYDIKVYDKISNNWKELWKRKIDYYEYQVKEIGSKYKNIKESFSYYVGLSELAISLTNYVDINEIPSYISHRRIKNKETVDSFCNPINIIVDTRCRDIGEYLKINYINESLSVENSIEYIDKIYFSKSEATLLLSRLLYPSYYFDVYDGVIQGKVDESKLNKYIEKNVYYETFLKEIYKYLRFRYNIPVVDWLES